MGKCVSDELMDEGKVEEGKVEETARRFARGKQTGSGALSAARLPERPAAAAAAAAVWSS
jgi:hypothetical protein